MGLPGISGALGQAVSAAVTSGALGVIPTVEPDPSRDGAFMAVMRGERRDPPPLWMMRQAGRYLPEYRALRADKGGFLDLCYDPESAAEVTLQPLRRFDMDAAILFSDILVVPHALGMELWFETGEGPRLAPPLAGADLAELTPQPQRLDPVYETVRRVRAELHPDRALIGFAGSPWTVATYMVAGRGTKDQSPARRLAYIDPVRFGAIINAIVVQTIDYLIGQVRAGANVLQIFDSWAGSLAPDEFDRWVIAPNAAIVAGVRAACPDTPIIGFPKGAAEKLPRYVAGVKPDAVGIDETMDPDFAHAALPPGLPVQGNLDPLRLVAGGPALVERVHAIRRAFAGRPHIFNLGHGIVPDTPIPHVETMVAAVRSPLS